MSFSVAIKWDPEPRAPRARGPAGVGRWGRWRNLAVLVESLGVGIHIFQPAPHDGRVAGRSPTCAGMGSEIDLEVLFERYVTDQSLLL